MGCMLQVFWRKLCYNSTAVSKIRKNIYRSEAQVIFELYHYVRCLRYRSFIPNKTTFIKYCITPKQLGNPLSKAIPGKFHGSGHWWAQLFTRPSQFHWSRAWQVILIRNTGTI